MSDEPKTIAHIMHLTEGGIPAGRILVIGAGMITPLLHRAALDAFASKGVHVAGIDPVTHEVNQEALRLYAERLFPAPQPFLGKSYFNKYVLKVQESSETWKKSKKGRGKRIHTPADKGSPNPLIDKLVRKLR